MEIKYAIPGLWNHFETTKKLVFYMENNPEAIRENVSIGAVYDNFPYTIWDGGRIFERMNYASFEKITEIRNFLKEKNIPLRLVFTNPNIEERHIYDRFCNLICKICEDENNEIVINSDILEEYLRKNYPKFNYISSTTKCNILDASLNEVDSNKYKYICLDYNANHKMDIFEKLPQNSKDKIEFLCNAICPPGCPYRKEHYRLNGLYYLNYMKPYTMDDCGVRGPTIAYETMQYKNNLSPEEIENIYAPMGFSMFKLEGRTLSTVEIVLNYARYFIKPEYQLSFILDMLR